MHLNLYTFYQNQIEIPICFAHPGCVAYRLPLHRPLYSRQLGQMAKTRQKLDSKKLRKLTNDTYACNSLTNFEYEWYVMTGNGNYMWICRKIACKNLWNHFGWTYFWLVLAIGNHSKQAWGFVLHAAKGN